MSEKQTSSFKSTRSLAKRGAPLDIIAVDILSGLPQASDGSKYILVLTDYFTKWYEAYALPGAEAHSCMSAMYYGFFLQFWPRKKFRVEVISGTLCLNRHCKITNDSVSSSVRWIGGAPKSSSVANVENKRHRPYPKLAFLLANCDVRMTVHSVTGITPNMAMLGRGVLTPVTLIAQPPNEPLKTTVPYVTSFMNAMREAHNRIRESTQSVARTQ